MTAGARDPSTSILSPGCSEVGRGQSGHSAIKNFDHITYATFGIDPAEFYAGRFVGASGTTDYLAQPKNRFDIEYGRARFLAGNVK